MYLLYKKQTNFFNIEVLINISKLGFLWYNFSILSNYNIIKQVLLIQLSWIKRYLV